MTLPKHILRELFHFFTFDPQAHLDLIQKHSLGLGDFFDNIDLIRKLAVATEQSRNRFLHDDSCVQLFLPYPIESIRYQNSFEDIYSSCQILEKTIDANPAFVSLWILGILRQKQVFWVENMTELELENVELYRLPTNFHYLSQLKMS